MKRYENYQEFTSENHVTANDQPKMPITLFVKYDNLLTEVDQESHLIATEAKKDMTNELLSDYWHDRAVYDARDREDYGY